MRQPIRLPSPPTSEDWRDWRDWGEQLVRALEQQTEDGPAAPEFTISNDTPTRTMDVSGVTAEEVANTLSQLITDLTDAGILGDT